MYLKRIEIQGFKSFADKTNIDFKNDITAIVGPNGSGKSNISDAIRWVLGEQSVRYLRGNKMEDIIFSGTDKRRPLGFAEVSIIFDNRDKTIPIEYNEVSIKRRMFRSGESEYYINNNLCRLKDIKMLIMDTGIGKEGYSIIGQGRIDEILSNRPEDRRNIFEEASGIVKYKSKKEEASKKLNLTDDNLIRIKDLVSEVSDQYKKLESDAEKANLFAESYNELKSLEVGLFLHEIKETQLNTKDLYEEFNKLNEQIHSDELEKESILEENSSLNSKVEEYEARIEDYKNQKNQMLKEIDRISSQIGLADQRESFIKKDIRRLEEEIVQINSLTEKNLNNLEELEVEEKLASDEYNKLSKDLGDKESQLSQINLLLRERSLRLEEDSKELRRVTDGLSSKKSDLLLIESKHKELIQRIREYREDLDTIESNMGLNKKACGILLKETEDMDSKLKDLSESLKNIQDKTTKYLSKKDKLENDIKSRELEIRGINSSLNLYRNMEISYEGYYSSVRNLIRDLNSDDYLARGFIGTVADLIKLEGLYEKAIEVSLAASMQNIVVDSDSDAKKLINHLKKKNLGRVTFLPLNTIKGRSLDLDKSLYKEYGILGLGHEIIKYDNKYENLFKYLLGRTIIVDNIDNAIRLNKDYGYRYRIVSLDGDLLNPGGSLTGGSLSKASVNILSRKNKIKELEKKLLIDSKDLELLQDNSHKLTMEIASLNEIVEKISDQIRNMELSYINLSLEKEAKEREGLSLESDYKLVSRNLGELNKEFEDLEIRKSESKNQLTSYMDKYHKLSNNNEELSLGQKNLIEDKDDIVKVISDLKLHASNLENKLSNIEYQYNNILKDKSTNKSLIKNKENILESLELELVSIDHERKEYHNFIAQVEEELKKIDKLLEDSLVEKGIIKDDLDAKKDKLYYLNDNINILERKKNQLDLKLSKLNLQIDNIISKLQTNYDLSYEEALVYDKVIEDMAKTRSRINYLKSLIKKIGNVNLSSIDDFKSTRERLEFLNKQYDDLIISRDNLLDIIEDMEGKMKRIFKKNFSEINNNFTQIFSHLFNGGRGALTLENPDDILNSGIEIEVQPPGKRLQNINLLSGGEKSLTAVAILFAILKTRPSPFCILDEIDAALDEANISRYTEYLKTYREDTQFILITHRKTTMEIANILYGVTMENEGVSKLVSVKLKDYMDEKAS